MSIPFDEPSSSSDDWGDFGGADNFDGTSEALASLPATPAVAAKNSGITHNDPIPVLPKPAPAANDVIPEQERAWMRDKDSEQELVLQFTERALEVAHSKAKGGAGMHGKGRQGVFIKMDQENIDFLKSVGKPYTSLLNGYVTALREASEGFDIQSHLDNDEISPSL